MHVAITLEFRFTQTLDGRLWSRTSHSYSFWERYLDVFDGVKIFARADRQPTVDERYRPVSGPGVSFIALPYYQGPWRYLKARGAIRETMRRAAKEEDAILCRVPSRIGTELLSVIPWRGHPYGLEVIGDPEQAFSPGAVHHPLRPMFRYMFTRGLKRECARATAVSYVTESALQRRYPTTGLSVGVSDIDLSTEYFKAMPRDYAAYLSRVGIRPEDSAGAKGDDSSARPRLLFIGTLEQMYKGQDVLLKAAAILKQWNCPVELTMVGDGRHRPELEALGHTLSIGGQVKFLGQLPAGAPIRAELDEATLMVLPSRTEGLPRVIIEAMARALPCVASNVGGIPELLHGDDLVQPDDPECLARKIQEVVTNPARLTSMSVRNLEKAQQFRPEMLDRKRAEFYKVLRDATLQWLSSRSQQSRSRNRLTLAH
jgi:glycosyltransferase involved in cell wall biosynthesis